MNLKLLSFLLIMMNAVMCFSQEAKTPWKQGIPQLKDKVKSLVLVEDANYKDSTNRSKSMYKWQYFFDKNGLCTSWSKLLKDTVIMQDSFTYSKSGKCLLEKCDRIKTDSRKEMWHVNYKYDSRDSLIEQIHINTASPELITKYNDQGDLTETGYYPYISKFINKYENGLLIEAIEMKADTAHSANTYKYNSEGKLIELIKKGHSGKVLGQESHSYNSSGHKYEWWTGDRNGTSRIQYSTEYDQQDNPVRQIWYNKDGSTTTIAYEYKYDSAGNWIEQTSRIGEKIIAIKTRTIEYY